MNILIKHLCIFFTLGVLSSCDISDMSKKEVMTQESTSEKMLLILAAPSIHNEYYSEYFDDIVRFQTDYIKKVSDLGNDKVRILIDNDTQKYYRDINQKYIISAEMYDIWMRDFTTVNPYSPIQFVYTDASMSKAESKITQKIFNTFADSYNLKYKKTPYVLDGGNVVDNYKDKAIVTSKFLTNNTLSYTKGKEVLKDLLGINEVAIIEPDDEVLAHADGMVAWLDDNTLAVNDYSEIDPKFHEIVMDELRFSFPDTNIVTVPVVFDEVGGIDTTKGIGSACGINLNLVMTPTTLYVPVFGNDYEAEVLEIIKNNTSKEVVTIDATGVCKYGGSVRCTTWQLAGKNMNKLLNK